MGATSTIRVRASTRDALMAVADERGISVDAVVREGLDLVRRERWARQAEIDARSAAGDRQDMAEIASVIRDLVG